MKTQRVNTLGRFARRTMTTPRISAAACFAAAAIVTTVFAAQSALADVYTWDNGTASAGGPTDGSGTWSLSSPNWWNSSSAYQFWPDGTDTAQFGFSSGHTNAYSVTLDPLGVNAGGVTFQDQAYTLSGSTLTLSGSTPTVTVNASGGTINSVIAGSSGIVKNGPGALTLGGANNYSGTTSITGGMLSLDFTQAGAPASNILPSGAPVSFGVPGTIGAANSLGMTGGSTNQQTLGGVKLSATSGLANITVTGGTLNLGAIAPSLITSNSGTSGAFVLFTVQNGGVITTTTGNDSQINTLIAGRQFGGFGVLDSVTGGIDNYQFARVVSGVISPTATTAMLTSGAVNNITNYALTASLNYTNVGTDVVGSLTINSASAGTLTLNAGANQFKCRAGVILQGSGDFTISSTNGSTFTGPNVEDDPFWVMGSRNLTLAMPFVDNNAANTATGITKLGPGTLTISASCTATGPTFLDQGTIVLTASAALPSGGFASAPGTTLNSNPGAGQLVKLMGNAAGVTNNGYTGGGVIGGALTISSGSLQVGGNGESISGAVTNNNGTLVLGGGNGLVSLNSQPSNNNAGGTYINGSGNVAINTTLSLSGSNVLTGEFYTGNNGGAGNVTVSNGTLNVGSWFEIGRLFSSTASNTSTSTFTATGPGTVVIADNLHQNNGSHVEIGWTNSAAAGGVTTGILNVLNGAMFDSKNSEIHLGVTQSGGGGQVGTVVLGNSSTDTAYINSGNANFFIGDAAGSTGNLTINGGSLTSWDIRNDSGAGNFTVNAGYAQATGFIRLGINASAVGNYIVNGGVLTNSATSAGGNQNSNLRLNIGENGMGTFTINGGLVSLTNPQNNAGSGIYIGSGSGVGTLNINGGTLSTVDPSIYVGAGGSSSGTINMNNGRVINTGGLVLGNALGASGSLFLNNGLFQASSISSVGGNGTLNFGGGTLQISGNGGIIGNAGGALTVSIGTLAAVIDTNGNNIQALVPFAPNFSNVGNDGGLIKMGAGVLAFNASNGQSSFLGPTQVSGGTLLVTGGFNTSSTNSITVASGAAFGGDGATPSVTLASSATLAPGYTILSPTQVGTISPAALTSNGGVLSFKLSNSSSSGNDQINVTGNVSLANVKFNISNLLNGSLQSGSYDLLNYGSSSALTNLTLTGLPLSRQTYSLDTSSSANAILLDVSAATPANLIWLGTNSTTWDMTTNNWFNTDASAVDKFFNLDNVSFTDLARRTAISPSPRPLPSAR